jgi:cellulose synthase/poly-beta-1,6-N-acetylglucosamine synthase-like glycosyltransferase
MSKIISSNNDLIRHRPTGVTILGVLFVIAGAFTLLGGQIALAQESGSILTVLGVLLIPLGIEILCIASFVVAYSLFEGKIWAWSVAVVLSIIGLVVNVISLVTASMLPMAGALVGIAINAIVLYYLSARNVRQYFGKVATSRQSASTTVGV